ncbi:hypothetical protein RAH42_00365 [Pyramidobacter sp. YE332]|uniref:hypothetical protein n=1 Tax=unclassified Pyramidobacter TaxID=2632171 RepID=UPI00098FA4F4|nr:MULTISPECIES: hypothetical protein [unclassified Pyramidobacter]OON87335.1 hypothetical protein B0D78_10165 [Pyramidobacter sp. C12-8]WOL40112.1 hypothetical protein RAH42_00365 [Pyramidobacter sp. YE332]
MKKLLALVFVLAMAAMAWAAPLDCGYFTADVPEGWTFEMVQQDDNSVTGVLKAPDNTLAFTVSALKASEQLTVKTAAGQFAQAHGATDLAKMDGEGESYEYTATVNNAPVYAQIFAIDDSAIGYIAVAGDHESELATNVFNSIEFKE